MRHTILFLAIAILSSCGGNKTAPTNQTAPTTSQENLVSYPSITLDEMNELIKRTTLIDYMFYELPMSMNLDNQGAINSALRQISDKPAQFAPSCKPMGRVIFQDDGEIFKEADFYFEAPCYGFIFIEDNAKTKSNMMTEEGAKFFQNLLNNAQAQGAQQ